MFENALAVLRAYDRIVIHRHKNPDGDALGSQIGLAALLRSNFPEKDVRIVGDAAGRYAFMEGAIMDEVPDDFYAGALAVILDTSATHLISDDRWRTAAHTLRFDHHIFCEKIADDEFTDTSYESCCGLIAAFAKETALKMSPLAAKSLYTGMVTDSGRFRYDATTSQTFALASYLLQTPFSISEIYAGLYADALESVQLRARFVLKIQKASASVAYIYTTKEEAAATGADAFTISRGMVGTMADIKGIDIWVNFSESDEGVWCELRSSRYTINPIAVKYGGGGHAKASGATLPDKAAAGAMLRDLCEMAGETCTL